MGHPTAFVGVHIALVCNYQLEKGVATGLGVFLESLFPLHACRSATRGHSHSVIDEVGESFVKVLAHDFARVPQPGNLNHVFYFLVKVLFVDCHDFVDFAFKKSCM